MSDRLTGVRPLLFASGLCALVYQVTWTRELRLIFGASSASSAAVLGVFMGGLGVGGIVLGARAESKPSPLRYYANLEIAVAIAAAFTPLFVRIVRMIYLAIGGQATLGMFGATLVRLLLSVVVLGLPTFLMGGTLPAAARAVSTAGDTSRKAVAGLYAANTFGAVTGALLANFVMLEIVGNRITLWIACLVNVLVGMLARVRSRSEVREASKEPKPEAPGADSPKVRLTFAVAAAAGFGFLLLELVWYRMLSPLLGGSSYTFGLILAIALFGIALGGALYARRPADVAATMGELGTVCALEALAVAVPFALGDRVAELTVLLRPLGAFGFYGLVAGWSVVAGIVVLPAAIVAGYQFPLIIGLVGQTREGVARDVGRTYAWNTGGAIAGSIASGFILLPRFGAERCWTSVVVVFAVLALVVVGVARRTGTGSVRDLAVTAALALVALVALRAEGPTAAWRHSPIGAGRMDVVVANATRNSFRSWTRDQRRHVIWQEDGVESSVAASAINDYTFLMNGRADGSARTDAGTQVMSGLVGALLIADAKTSLVVGLGTGSTAGWLAKVPGMERVDVVELESAMLRVARDLAPVNQDVLSAPNVHITIGDAREVLQTTRETYDIIFSEPSNPFRAGISSLYTRDFYEDVQSRLRPSGVFVQWLQLYEVDGFTIRTAIATVHCVFAHTSLWETTRGDLIITATKDAIAPDVARMRRRIAEEPFKTALRVTWGVDDVEGVLAHHIAAPALADAIAQTSTINTDDLNLLEYSFARNVGKGEELHSGDDQLWALSMRALSDLPAWARGVDLGLVERRRLISGRALSSRLSPELVGIRAIIEHYGRSELAQAGALLEKTPFAPSGPAELVAIASVKAFIGTDDAAAAIDRVRELDASDAHALDAELAWKHHDGDAAAAALEAAFVGYRTDAWADIAVRFRAIDLAAIIVLANPAQAKRLYDALATTFAVRGAEVARLTAWLRVAAVLDAGKGTSCREVFHAFEPMTPWASTFLRGREECYRRAGDPLLARATGERAEFVAASAMPLADEGDN